MHLTFLSGEQRDRRRDRKIEVKTEKHDKEQRDRKRYGIRDRRKNWDRIRGIDTEEGTEV